jgi:peptidoglycan glycosyltransferase
MNRIASIIRSCCAVLGVAVIAAGFTLPADGSQAKWLACLAIGATLIAVRLWPRPGAGESEDDRPPVNVFAVIAFFFAIIAVQMARFQAIFNGSIAGRAGIDPASGDVFSNPRAIDTDLVIHRGSMTDRSGNLLARSKLRDGVYDREYPVADASYVCGYFSPLKYGRAGLEASWDDELSGRNVGNPIEDKLDRLLGRPRIGANLELTIDSDLHSQAHALMADRTGAVIVNEIATGAVLVLASNPHFDPARLAAFDTASSRSATSYWSELNADPAKPLLVRAIDGLYTPGSTFKTVTVSAAIETGVAKPSDVYTDDGELDVDGHLINEENRPDDTVTQWTLEEGLAYSLNVVFAQVGLQLGADRLETYAGRFGFGAEIPFDVPVATGQIASTPDFLRSQAGLADTAFGQGQLQTSPLGMALVVAAIANGGRMMRPFIVNRVTTQHGSSIKTTAPRVWRQPIEQRTAQTVQDLMVNTVVNGYANGASVDGFVVGGKTGTAESGSETPHAWFIGFIGDPDPKYGIAVVLEYGGEGIQGPIQIARELLASTIASSA